MPKVHTASELRYRATVLGPDAMTVIATGLGAGVTDLSGRAREQSQLVAPESTHMVLFWWADGHDSVTPASYITINGDPALYIVDGNPIDPRNPRPRVWLEVYCHVERVQS